MPNSSWDIYNGDCIDMMQLFVEDNSVDAVVTDPPYGMKYQSGRREDKFALIEGDDNLDIFERALPEIVRVMKPNSHAYIFCSWHEVDRFSRLVKDALTLKNIIVWNKNNHGSGDLTGAYAPKHEFVLFAHKGRRTLTKRIPDVIDFAKVPGRAMVHPTEKPVGLLDIFINNSTVPGEVVLDPFTGGGSTGISAVGLGRRFIGSELVPEYFTIAQDRIAAAAVGDLLGVAA